MITTSRQKPYTIGRRIREVALIIFIALPLCVFPQKSLSGEVQLQKCWEYRYTGNAGPQIVSDSGSVFVRRESSGIDAIAVDSGKLVWTTDVGGSIDSNLAVAGGNVVLVRKAVNPETPPSLVALSSVTGITKWATTLRAGEEFVLVPSGGTIVVISRSGSISGVDALGGSIVWTHSTPTEIVLSTVLGGPDLYFAYSDRNVRSISLAGILSPGFSPFPFALTSLVRSDDGAIVTGDERGQITAYSPLFRNVEWQFTSGAAVSSLLETDELLIAASNDNFIYALSLGSGRRIWKKRVSGRVQSMRMMGPDAVVVQTIADSAVQVLSIKTGKSAGQIILPLGEVAVAITPVFPKMVSVLSDGALYMFGGAGCKAK
ncbi:MAG: PQQ-binding-like beta-propeller repeat protein [Acidobacteriota bacterium]